MRGSTVTTHPDELGADALIGTDLDGRYRIESFLGAGTMGAVYKATQLAVGRRVAIKVLNKTLKTNNEVRERFRVEAQAIAALSHPNCITLFDFGYNDKLGALYMVVEYLEGDTLEQYLAIGLELDLALAVSFQVADVLAHAHEAGVLHRDLKPENIMLIEGTGKAPTVKVLDFGLARIFDDRAPGGSRLTRQGQLFGTPAYMSPEQCGSAMDVGPAADVYSLGVTMYELLTGRLPFFSDNVAELLIKHVKEPPEPLDHPDLPDGVADLVTRMLAKNPAHRPTSPEVADALREYATLTGRLPARPKAPASEPEEIAPRARTGKGGTDQIADGEEPETSGDEAFQTLFAAGSPWRLPAVVGAVLTAVAVVVGLVVFRSDEEPANAMTPPPDASLAEVAAVAEPPAVADDVVVEQPEPSPTEAAEASAEAAASALSGRVAIVATAHEADAGADDETKPEQTATQRRQPVRERIRQRAEKRKTGERDEKTRKARTLDFKY